MAQASARYARVTRQDRLSLPKRSARPKASPASPTRASSRAPSAAPAPRDAATQTELKVSRPLLLGFTDGPPSRAPSPDPELLASFEDTPHTGWETPKRSRANDTEESWGLASLDPSTWPVFKDTQDGFGFSSVKFNVSHVSMASVPEGPGDSLASTQNSEEALARVYEQTEGLRQLCYDFISLALDSEQEVPSESLLSEGRRCLDLLRGRLQASKPKPEIAVKADRPHSYAIDSTSSTAAGPCAFPQRIPTSGSISATSWPTSVAAPPICSPAQAYRTPAQVTRFISDGACVLPRATTPLCQAAPVHCVRYASPILQRSRSVSVTRRQYRQCWVLEREERIMQVVL
ncbi:unnamed protein product [Effrenium voratum]|nr:unnamed protein product [Effrenium voratum]